MIVRTLASLALIALAAAGTSPLRAAITTSQDLQRVCDEFAALGLDPGRAHDVKSLSIVRDIGTLRLDAGVLIFSKQIEGVTPAAVFIGKGSFTLTPIRKMDREMLDITAADYLGSKPGGMINTGLTQAVLFAYDATWSGLQTSLSKARPATADELGQAGPLLKEQISLGDRYYPLDQIFDHEVGVAAEFGIIAAALHDPSEPPETLRVEMKTDLGGLSFAWLPSKTYEVRLGTRSPLGAFLDYHPLVITHRKEDLDAAGRYVADPVKDRKETIKVNRYRMNLEIPDLQQINIDVDAGFTPQVENLPLIAFDLVNDVGGPRWDSRAKYVDTLSVKDAGGKDLPFLHRKHRILILPAGPPAKGQEISWSFKLNEKTITQFSDNHFSLLNTFPWFPQYGYLGGVYEFDWTVKTVKPYSATGSGTVLKRWEEDRFNAVEMTFDTPVWLPSIIFGRYQAEEGEYQSQASGKKIPLAAWSWPTTNYFFGTETFSVNVPRNKPGDVIAEGKEILKFMEDLYGPFPYEKLDIAMMAPGFGFGQSPPAFVQLTGEAFMSSATIAQFARANPDFFHEFFAHEVAHQWWAHKIKWTAWEDTWLSESFAEYSSGLYVLGLQGKQRYLDKLRRWKENAMNADAHGSIAWCNNLSGTNGFLWRTQLIYNKGPYVVHMLRMMLGKDKFSEAMKAVFAKHPYEMITTDALQAECEKVAGYDLDFFFDQWFRGTGIPVFDYSWDASQTEDGSWLVSVKISQRDKQRFKQVLMPIYFYFKGQAEPLIRPRPITEADHVYKLKLPQKPERIVLDEDHDILGDMIPATSSGM